MVCFTVQYCFKVKDRKAVRVAQSGASVASRSDAWHVTLQVLLHRCAAVCVRYPTKTKPINKPHLLRGHCYFVGPLRPSPVNSRSCSIAVLGGGFPDLASRLRNFLSACAFKIARSSNTASRVSSSNCASSCSSSLSSAQFSRTSKNNFL